jgi:rSAM/selenodomain-associated transferase 1
MRALPVLVVMAKAPVCGAVKTRLAQDIGAVRATALARASTSALLRETARDPRFDTLLAVSPPQARHRRFLAWNGLEKAGMPKRIAQCSGGLGARMQDIFDRCGRGPLIIVGTDIPFVRSGMIAEAFRLLRGADAVFGPAEDGGYWLVGLRRRPKLLRPFSGVRWSSQHALADTLENLSAYRIVFAKTMFDIDGEADYRRYRRLCTHGAGGISAASTRIPFEEVAPHFRFGG